LVFKLGELAKRVGGEVHGDGDCEITNVATLHNAKPGAVSFLANPHYRQYLTDTAASAVIVSRADLDLCPVNALVVTNPYAAYARVAALLNPAPPAETGIHASAVVGGGCVIHETAWVGPLAVLEDGVRLGARVSIGPGCVIGAGSTLGEDARLVARVTLCQRVVIGKRALVHPGVVIGSDGFGLANEDGVWLKVPQLGGVRIGDDVEIGANTTIDRGALEDTVLEDGVKLDNQIQVAHNVRIGAHTAIAGCVGIAGSAKIGKRCTIGGGAGILGHLEIADDVHITAMSLVTKSLREAGVYSSGTPLEPNPQWRKNVARFRQLDSIARRLSALEREKTLHNKE